MKNLTIKKTLKLLVTTTVLAGLASGINAWWCFAGFPVRLLDKDEMFFKWQIIPMGAVHGAIIALITIERG